MSRRERVTAWWGWTFIAQRVCAPLDTVGRLTVSNDFGSFSELSMLVKKEWP